MYSCTLGRSQAAAAKQNPRTSAPLNFCLCQQPMGPPPQPHPSLPTRAAGSKHCSRCYCKAPTSVCSAIPFQSPASAAAYDGLDSKKQSFKNKTTNSSVS